MYNVTINGTNRTLDNQTIQPLLKIYDQSNLDFHAGLDTTDYSLLKGTDFETEEMRAAYFYTQYPPLGYYVDFPTL